MPVRVLSPHWRVDAVRNCVAVQRGPLVYCLEADDLAEGTAVEDVFLDVARPLEPTHDVPAGLQGYVRGSRGRIRAARRGPRAALRRSGREPARHRLATPDFRARTSPGATGRRGRCEYGFPLLGRTTRPNISALCESEDARRGDFCRQ